MCKRYWKREWMYCYRHKTVIGGKINKKNNNVKRRPYFGIAAEYDVLDMLRRTEVSSMPLLWPIQGAAVACRKRNIQFQRRLHTCAYTSLKMRRWSLCWTNVRASRALAFGVLLDALRWNGDKSLWTPPTWMSSRHLCHIAQQFVRRSPCSIFGQAPQQDFQARRQQWCRHHSHQILWTRYRQQYPHGSTLRLVPFLGIWWVIVRRNFALVLLCWRNPMVDRRSGWRLHLNCVNFSAWLVEFRVRMISSSVSSSNEGIYLTG